MLETVTGSDAQATPGPHDISVMITVTHTGGAIIRAIAKQALSQARATDASDYRGTRKDFPPVESLKVFCLDSDDGYLYQLPDQSHSGGSPRLYFASP